MAAIETWGLVRAFGDTRAVDEVDLIVPAGGVYGLLGPNGAGKTTVIRMLATLLAPDAGTARVFGHDVVGEGDAVRSRIGLTGQFASIDEELTGRENLVLVARLLGHDRARAKARAAELLEAFGLTDAADRLVKGYSGGMRRRLDIAVSIVVSPQLLFLDEPTTGLDPRSRVQVWDIVDTLVADGATILLTTQYLDEADRLAGRVAVIDRGRIVAEGTPGQLKAQVGGGRLSLRVADADRRDDAAALLAGVLGSSVRLDADPHGLHAQLSSTAGADAGAQATAALGLLSSGGIAVSELAIGQPSLDEVFMALTGHPPPGAPDTGADPTTERLTASDVAAAQLPAPAEETHR